ncbi:hypothetical protein D9619_003615 [Psilocybe cf. subviscida]|uniref:Major facilitator superfamily (MFS) profile domain-containing protein n=1 Tax=Psilocybe cf. subviscida TaxID=2480587 RepID=A0A8H5AXJ5_9AGAR|nr:hypothetical protein D9619_003615 [Psilocybe cf. subviscida]
MVEIQDQTSRLTGVQLFVVFVGLNLALLTSFLDATSVSTALPDIADDLNAGTRGAWITLTSSLALLAFGNLLCGFAKSEAWLYACRAIAGIGGGGTNSLTVMIILSDIVSIHKRAKDQSLLGISIALGFGVGPLIGGALSEKASWRWAFWFTVSLNVFTIALIWFLLPLKHVTGGVKLMKIDWFGSFVSLAAIVCILVPIPGGGTLYGWTSPAFLATLLVGVALAVVVLVVESKYAKLPVMPLHIFRVPTVSLVILQAFFVGMIFYGGTFFTPIYLPNVLGYSPLMPGVLILPLVLVQVFSTSASGFIIEKMDRIKPAIVAGFALWLAGQAAQTVFDRSTNVGTIVGILLVQGLGVGAAIQSGLVLAQASAAPIDRAAVTGTRNFARTSGGALGLAASNAILNNLFQKNLPPNLPADLRARVLDSMTDMPGDLDPSTRDAILDAYNNAIHWVFVYFAPDKRLRHLPNTNATAKKDEPPISWGEKFTSADASSDDGAAFREKEEKTRDVDVSTDFPSVGPTRQNSRT